MSRYDDLFDNAHTHQSVFADKAAFDPLREPVTLVAREAQERQLAGILNGVHDGYLPTTVSIYGPPGTGKTSITRRVCQEFADRTEGFGMEYVNLKECQTIFSAANELHQALTGTKLGAYEGLDGVFDGIWTALEAYPEWTVLLLDEIDHIQYDTNHDPNDFLYRLLRGEGKLRRDLNLSVWLISNKLLNIDLKVDSRVESAMSGAEVFFPPYDATQLRDVIDPRIAAGFHADAIADDTVGYAIHRAAARWGDARKTLTLFREAGDTANDRELDKVTRECIDANLKTADKAALTDKLLQLPTQHFLVLNSATNWTNRHTGEIVQPVTTDQIHDAYTKEIPDDVQLSQRAIQSTITDLDTMGLIDTWIESRGRGGRVKQIETTFDPEWIDDIKTKYFEQLETKNPN